MRVLFSVDFTHEIIVRSHENGMCAIQCFVDHNPSFGFRIKTVHAEDFVQILQAIISNSGMLNIFSLEVFDDVPCLDSFFQVNPSL